jgi:hypothetical protein
MLMTGQKWGVADQIARELARRDCDPNEVAKAFVHLRTHRKDTRRFFDFLKTLADRGQFLVRSRRTLDYYRDLQEVCNMHLAQYRSDPDGMAQVLGWAVRLMRYYVALRPAEPARPSPGQKRSSPWQRR